MGSVPAQPLLPPAPAPGPHCVWRWGGEIKYGETTQGSQGAAMGPRYHGTLRSESPRLRAGRGGCRSGGPPDLPSSRAPPDRAGERGGLGRRHPSEWVCPPSHAQLLGLHFPGGVCGRGDLGRVPRAPQVQFPLGAREVGVVWLSLAGALGGSRGAWVALGAQGPASPGPGLTERAAGLRGAGCGEEEGRGPAGPSRGRGAPRRLLPAPPARPPGSVAGSAGGSDGPVLSPPWPAPPGRSAWRCCCSGRWAGPAPAPR